jgi:hypothetical protein
MFSIKVKNDLSPQSFFFFRFVSACCVPTRVARWNIIIPKNLNLKSQVGYILDGLGMKKNSIFYGQL